MAFTFQEVSCSPDHNSHIFNGAKGMKFTFPSGFMVYCKVENATTGNTCMLSEKDSCMFCVSIHGVYAQ